MAQWSLLRLRFCFRTCSTCGAYGTSFVCYPGNPHTTHWLTAFLLVVASLRPNFLLARKPSLTSLPNSPNLQHCDLCPTMSLHQCWTLPCYHQNRWADLASQIATAETPLYIHCAQGHGRTGLVAALFLLAHGDADTPDTAIEMIQSSRPLVGLNGVQRASLLAASKLLPSSAV